MRHSERPVTCYLSPLIAFTLLYNLPRFWELRLGSVGPDTVENQETLLSNVALVSRKSFPPSSGCTRSI